MYGQRNWKRNGLEHGNTLGISPFLLNCALAQCVFLFVQVDLRRMPQEEKKRVMGETEILDKLNHPYIIKFFDVWKNDEKDQICFTTEIVTSGTLKQYTQRSRAGLKMKVMKRYPSTPPLLSHPTTTTMSGLQLLLFCRWCRQILDGLHYLHSHNPPIIHRDLKCDNIFMNGSTGEIRIGDFGLSASRHKTTVNSVLGTPEFMAPELYEESYNEMVDVRNALFLSFCVFLVFCLFCSLLTHTPFLLDLRLWDVRAGDGHQRVPLPRVHEPSTDLEESN